MKTFFPAMLLTIVAVSPAAAQTPLPPSHDRFRQDLYENLKDLKWEKLLPELGDASPEITYLHKDPKTGGEQLMIRSGPNYAPRRWHKANETHIALTLLD
jgi:hypothetical protein